MRSRTAGAWGSVLAALAVVAAVVPGAGAQGGGDDPVEMGVFSEPFAEPTVSDARGYPRVETDQICVEREGPDSGPDQNGVTRGFLDCKPAAGGLVQLTNGKNLYWDNLAGTENVETSILAEYGVVGLNEQSRVLDAEAKTWAEPSPVDGGAVSEAPIEPVTLQEILRTHEPENDGSLFCSDGNLLADGRFIAIGGTKYTNDPGVDGTKFGATELYGIENARIFDPDDNTWTQTGSMSYPRWYPTATTLGDGRIFVASGLRKLEKAVNLSDPIDPSLPNSGFGLQEGQNERWTETWDPATGEFTRNPPSARRSLPLFPRMHLLPNGNVLYNAAGQSFNPLGQAYDMALWNIASTYDPDTQTWHDLGVPGIGTTPVPGFRGSTFSVMMPLKPDADGDYDQASFLTGGGVTGLIAAPSPGSYMAIRDSYLSTIDTSGEQEAMTTQDAGDMAATSTPVGGRWYGSGTLLPTGEVLVTSGADRDEVVLPGLEAPVMRAELFDPETGEWRQVAEQNNPRTYHNTAALMPDGRVLVGGHSTISNSYLSNITIPGGITAPNGRDPSFEIYSPPYMFCGGSQARIESVQDRGGTLTVQTDVPAEQIESVVLVRNASVTHITDADQRNVELRILSRSGNSVTVQQAPNGNVLPPGPYMLFVNRRVGECVKPSHSAQVFAGQGGRVAPLASCLASRSRVGARRVGPLRLGMTRAALRRSRRLARVAAPRRSAASYSYCVQRTRARVTVVFGRRGRAELIRTGAPRHGSRGLRRGASLARLKRAFPRAERIGRGLYRATPRGSRLVGVRKGRVRFWAVAGKRLLRPASQGALRASLRRAGS